MIEFKEDTHQYFNDNKEIISVTTLMSKHALSPDYSNVPSGVLSAKAERGSLIHKEIEEFIKDGNIGFTSEMLQFKRYIEENNIDVILSEQILYNDIVAGTVDLVTCKNGVYSIADIKTTSTLHKDAVSWQLSIYAYLYNRLHEDTTAKVTKGLAYHFSSDGTLNVVDITLKPMDQVEMLLDCERNNVRYNQYNISLANDTTLDTLTSLEHILKELDEKKKKIDAQAQEIRQQLLEAMQQQGYKTFETDQIKLTVKDAYTRTTIDSAKLKKEMPEIAEQYTKTSETKATLIITLKGE